MTVPLLQYVQYASTKRDSITFVKDPREVTILPYLRMSGFCASSMMASTERDSITPVNDPREVTFLTWGFLFSVPLL